MKRSSDQTQNSITIMATAAPDKTIYYSFKSPVIGHHAPGNPKLQDESITRLSYRPQPCQKDHVLHVDQTSVAKNLKFDCYYNTPKTVTQDAFSAPSDEKQTSSKLNYGHKDFLLKTPHEMAQDYRYVSNIRSIPDKNERDLKRTTNQLSYTPIPSSYLTNRQLHHYNIHSNANLGNQVFDSNMQSEYGKSFVREIRPVKKSASKKPSLNTIMSHYSPRGGAKLNISHNIITGDRFNKCERKVGTTHHSDDYCAWPVDRPKVTRNPAVHINVTSIQQGDRDKVFETLSGTHSSFQNPGDTEGLRFNTSEMTGRTYQSSFRHHSDAKAFSKDAYSSTSKMDYHKHDAERVSLAGSAFTRGASSFPKGDLNPARVQERLDGDAAKCSHIKHSSTAWRPHVDRGGWVTHSNVQLGTSKNAPLSDVTCNHETFVPYSDLSQQRIIPPPKDVLTLKFPPDYFPSSCVTEPLPKPVNRARLISTKIKNALDYSARWTLNSSGEPYYVTTHKDDFSADVLAKSIA